MTAALTDALIDTMAPAGAPSDDDVTELSPAWMDDGEPIINNWKPSDAPEADWVARKHQRATTAIADLQAQRDGVVAQWDAWLERETIRHGRTIQWAEAMLRIWLDAQIAADDSKKPRKSRALPSGVTVKRTTGGQSLVIEDQEAMVGWLIDNYPEHITYTPKKADVKQLMTGDGLAVPGASIVKGDDGFKVEVA